MTGSTSGASPLTSVSWEILDDASGAERVPSAPAIPRLNLSRAGASGDLSSGLSSLEARVATLCDQVDLLSRAMATRDAKMEMLVSRIAALEGSPPSSADVARDRSSSMPVFPGALPSPVSPTDYATPRTSFGRASSDMGMDTCTAMRIDICTYTWAVGGHVYEKCAPLYV